MANHRGTLPETSRLLCRLPASTAVLFTLLTLPVAVGIADDRIERERSGEEVEAPPTRAIERSFVAAGAIDLLLVPESTNDAVMAFDPETGDLVDPAFIPSDPDNLTTPIQAIVSAAGDSILVSDQIEDVVHEYDLDGNHLRIFAPAGGPDLDLVDNVRGITLSAEGTLLVAVSSGPNGDSIAEFDGEGGYLGNRVPNGEGGLNGPWGVLIDGDSLYVTGDFSDSLQEFDTATGAFVADLDEIESFPEQIALDGSGTLLVANLNGTDLDLVEVDPAVGRTALYDVAELSGTRGVYLLGNGNLLVTDGDGVHEITRSTGELIETKIDGVSARFISRATITPPPPPIIEAIGECPGELLLTLVGGTPNGVVGFLRGDAEGSDPLDAGPCVGTESGLSGPRYLGPATLDAAGGLSILRSIPRSFCGLPLQAIVPDGCVTTNVTFLP